MLQPLRASRLILAFYEETIPKLSPGAADRSKAKEARGGSTFLRSERQGGKDGEREGSEKSMCSEVCIVEERGQERVHCFRTRRLAATLGSRPAAEQIGTGVPSILHSFSKSMLR